MSSKAHKSDVQETKIPSRQRSRKFMNVTVYFLDDSSHVFQLQAKNLGQVLFDKVCKHINLLEVDYFGLECEDEKGTKFWLDVLKPLCSQLPTSFPTMYFCVKFYTPDPAQLEDEFTRYLFSLQIKKDLTSGALQCNDNTVAVLISYIVQADFGDFIPEKCIDHSYLSSYKFVPYQNQELEKKVMENHKKILGQTPAEADLNLLETARRCELYGVKMTAAKDQEGGPLNLAAVHIGVLVFQNFTKINTFSWVKIRKLSFKRKKFLIKLHPEAYYKDTVEYTFEGRNECKNFWKKCIENHTFFRCTDAKQGMRLKPKIFSRGSSFRYSGRTQKQVSEYVREQCIKRSPFQRSTSLKTPTSPTKSIGSGSAIIPQPLLPVTSLSCGSISDISKDTIPVPKATSEPSTPHTTQDFSKAINGSYSKDSVVTPISGVVSPEIDQEGFQSPDFGRQDTDDNLSHDSYHVLEKEVQSANLTAATNSADLSNNKSHESLSNNKEDEAKEIKENIDDEQNMHHSNYVNGHKSLENNNNNADKSPLEEFKIDTVHQMELSSPISLQSQEINDLKNLNLILRTKNSAEDNVLSKMSQNYSSSELENIGEQQNFDQRSVTNTSFRSLSEESFEGETDKLKDSEQNFGASTFYISSPYAVRLSNKKRVLNDKAYCLTKELLMSERTYRKDLEILNVIFRDEFNIHTNVHSEAIEHILAVIDPLYEMHCSLLRGLEQRLAFWEGRPVNKNLQAIKGVADILLQQKGLIKVHSIYLEKLPELLELLHQDLNKNQNFANLYHQFESQKVCYLPLTSFLLRPTFRLLYYNSLLKGLLNVYNTEHVDYINCISMLEELNIYCASFESVMLPLVNYSKLMELQRHLMGFSDLVDTNRIFLREGSLSKFTKNGSHQHMFFLFSDFLLYTVRVHDGQPHFKVQEQFPCDSLTIQETEPKLGINHCFVLSTSEKHLLLASPSATEHSKWMRDFQRTIQKAKGLNSNKIPSREDSVSSLNDKFESGDEDTIFKDEKPTSINTSIHICWHRNISISCNDLYLSMKNGLSGYLLRKFKNSSGWQKVWVVLANLCLFFYRSYLDESPLASLPLAGYKIMNTSSTDLISGECIFKLVFKSHEYFFMVENKYSFERWMEAIHSCTLMEEENTHL